MSKKSLKDFGKSKSDSDQTNNSSKDKEITNLKNEISFLKDQNQLLAEKLAEEQKLRCAEETAIGRLKTKLSDEKIAELQKSATIVLAKNENINRKDFYNIIAIACGVSYGTARKYCKDLYKKQIGE